LLRVLQAGDASASDATDAITRDAQQVLSALAQGSSNSEGNVRDWVGNLASERFAGQPDVLASLQTCITEQRTIQREKHYSDPNTGVELHLRSTYVFVPPRTVMAHIEDVTHSRPTDPQRAGMPHSQELSDAFNNSWTVQVHSSEQAA
jgi:hypothetical protein